MTEKIYISVGGNIGNREENMSNTVKTIARQMKITAISSLYETTPWGMPGQPNFLNAVICADYDGEPDKLFAILQAIEDELGRTRSRVWSSRTVDLDILLFGTRIINTLHLIIPHRHLALRDFYLVPLLEIFQDAVEPTSGIKYCEYERRMPTQIRTIIAKKEVTLWQDTITSLLKVQ